MQTLNRNNYEEYFLLYTDGELDAIQQQAVENFVEQNPDLAVELEMLLSTKLTPEAIEFDSKETLLRTEGNSINEHNYEEYFLLYIDNELSEAKRREVEMYVLQHPKLQDEFTTLKQAVLTPEAISYGNKNDLYRTEKRRTIYFKPWRLAAAAIFIGLCAVGLWMMQKPAIDNTNIAINKTELTTPEQKQSTQNSEGVKPVATDSVKKQTLQTPLVAQKTLPVKEAPGQKVETASIIKKKESITAQQNENNIEKTRLAKVQPEHNVIARNNIVKQQKEPPVETHDIVTDIPEDLNEKPNDFASMQRPVNNNAQQSNYKIYNVAYKEISTDDEDRSLRVGMLDLNKDKVKGFLKKAGRIFGKSNNTNEDGKLQVANFEIDTKKQ